MHPFEHKISAAITTRSLLRTEAGPVVIGLSGGADSVALLSALVSLGYDVIAAHCNFHLRGEESDRDCRHAMHIADTLGARWVMKDFDVEYFVSNSPSPTSLEMACRELRYDWFETIRKDTGAQAIAIAHNYDDNLETVLLNLFRGSGIRGLRGIKPHNNRHIVRPMLDCSRKEVEAYLAEKEIPYVTDSTNLENDFARNKMRNVVLPAVDSQFPLARKGITTSAHTLAATEIFLQQVLLEKRQQYSTTDGDIDLIKLTESESQPDFMLYEWFSDTGLTASQAADIIRSATSSGKVFPTSHGRYVTDHGYLRFFESRIESSLPSVQSIYEITTHPVEEFRPQRDNLTVYFDANLLSINDLEVRFWQKGDRMAPFGMKGSRKLSDIFSDAKISVEIKDTVPLLITGKEILWVTGLRASRLYKITSATKRFIKVRYIGPQLF